MIARLLSPAVVFLICLNLSASASISFPVVFVSRQIPAEGSVYWDEPGGMPGVGPWSRFQVAAPGKLQILEPNGDVRTLVNGANPTAQSLNLIDVNAPEVSYDGTKIVFAGIVNGAYNDGPVRNPGAWRIYVINVDGTGLHQITTSDQNLDLSQFGNGSLAAYDDTDPAWLPDGRIVFSSTRWPSIAQYSGVRTTNLHVVNANGSGLHRITSERNGADRPLVDPVTGKIVFARWWRNHRFAINSMQTVPNPNGGFTMKNGLSAERGNMVGGPDFLWRNAWHAASINPDGTGLAMFTGAFRDEAGNHIYGGAFTPEGELVANFFPMYNMTEAGGFGGLRTYPRGPGRHEPLIGITYLTLDYAHESNPTSYGIFNGDYAADPDVLPDGTMVLSWAPDVEQDYGLYTMNADGSGLTLLYDQANTTELRARLVRPRALPPVIAEEVVQTASLLPPTADGPYDVDGTFVFDALNVYFNAPVDVDIVSAPPVGSANTIRFFIDQQRTSPGSFPNLDWPILLKETTIEPDGSVREDSAPANVPLFEQIRSKNNLVPFTGGPFRDGAAHVAGMNYGRPGTVAKCVGCHTGHTMIELPEKEADSRWTNLAPGAAVTVSSTRDANQNGTLIDRRVRKGEIWRTWTSANGQTQNQWVQLTFPVPVVVKTVRLYNVRPGDDANSTLQVTSATVKLYKDKAATNLVTTSYASALSTDGTDVAFNKVKARVVRIEINGTTGTFYGMNVAGLAEIEVIARGAG